MPGIGSAGDQVKPGDLVRDYDGDVGIIVSKVRDPIRPITWVYYIMNGEIVSDDEDNLEVIDEAG